MKTFWIIAGVIIVAGGISVGTWFVVKNLTTEPAIPAQNEAAAGWQYYKNDTHQYSIKYPSNWFFYEKLNPPPPNTVMVGSLPEFSKPGDYASVEIFVTDAIETDLNEISEVKSLVKDGSTKTETRIDGEKAVKLESEDTIAHQVSYYMITNQKQYRIGYQYPLNDATGALKCAEIVDSFRFIETNG